MMGIQSMTETSRMRRLPALLAVAAVTLALVGCTGGEADEEGRPDGAPDEKVIEISDQPGSVEDYAGALEDSDMTRCEPGGDGLQVAGTVTNPESATQDYRIYVSALDSGDTVGLVQVDVTDVSAGETAEWATELALAGEDLECVLRVERFASAG